MLVPGLALAQQPRIAMWKPQAPLTVFTQDAAAMRPGGSADQLVLRAHDQGKIRVIIGLRTTMQPEHTLAPEAAKRQASSILSMQDRIARRALGRTDGQDIDKFTFIPFMSLYVNATQARPLLSDTEVATVEQDLSMQLRDVESMSIMHADDVWATGNTGSNHVVAVLDAGVDKTHPVLKGKVVSEACYSTNQAGIQLFSLCPKGAAKSTKPGSGRNCHVEAESCGHGTSVASVAAGGGGLELGIAPGAEIIAIQVLTGVGSPSGGGSVTAFSHDVILGLQRVYTLRKTFHINAVNLSLGTQDLPGYYSGGCDDVSPAFTTAISNLRSAGIATAIATGNLSHTNAIGYPACITSAIAVGNSTKLDTLTSSSDHSPLVKLLAVATDVQVATPGGGYSQAYGTSFASPAVAGAFAVLAEAKPSAKVDDILAALVCSGKVIDKSDNGSDINPPVPRIDLIGAYNYLVKPSNATRTWSFSTVADGADWTPFLGKWEVTGGHLVGKSKASVVFDTVANCNKNLTIEAKISAIQPFDWLNEFGVLFKARIDYGTFVASGYFASYNACRTNKMGECTQDSGDPIGQALFYRIDNGNLKKSYKGGWTLLCSAQAPENVSGFNTVKIVSNGSSHSYYLNGTLACTVNDATYVAGRVMLGGYSTNPSQPLKINSVTITSMDTPALAPPPMDPSKLLPKAAPLALMPFHSGASR